MNATFILIFFLVFASSCCEKEELIYSKGDLKITIETGNEWLHDFPLFLGIIKKNPPTFAIWVEDTSGNYLSTIFATYKIATESWLSNNGNRRKESLPHWCYRRNVIYDDGLLLPTKKEPLPDGITGATPKKNKEIQVCLKDFSNPIVIKAEFNHSIDFNDYFPKNAKEEDDNYSGGEMGSGQPALIYADTIYPTQTIVNLKLIGRSSSDGTDGNIYTDLEKITTAKNIVKNITVELIK